MDRVQLADLPERVQEVIEKIVEGYDPEKIIIFGSYARGDWTEDSDLDVLVVKETRDTDLDVREAIRQLLPHRPMRVQSWVRSQEEVDHLLGERSLFMHTVLNEGITVYGGRHGDGGYDVRHWLAKAREALDLAEHFESKGLHYPTCLQCWFVAHRLLQALIVAHWAMPPDTEDLVGLLELAATLEIGLPDLTEQVSLLNRHGPLENVVGPVQNADDADAALRAACAVDQTIREVLSPESTTNGAQCADQL